MIPKAFTIGGYSFSEDMGLSIPVPGHDGWVFSAERKGAFVCQRWYQDDTLVHMNVFNITNNGINYSLVAGGKKIHKISSQSGYGWTDEEWLEAKAQIATTPWDKQFDIWEDPDITKETGSANVSFYSPAEVIANHYGVSPSVLKFYDRYARKQIRRPRWWLTPLGLPVNMQDPNAKLPKFSEWMENSQGLNAYDVQHLDGYELYSGYKFTGDPSYLFSLMNLWYHATSNNWYLQHKSDQTYGGSQRTLGWYLALSCQLYELTSSAHGFQSVAEKVKQEIVWHVNNGMAKFPISSIPAYGTIPAEFKEHNKNYVFGWQYAVAAHGYLLVNELFGESDPALATKASSHAHQIMSYITAHCDDGPDQYGNGWVGYIWAVDETPEFLIKSSPPGVADWYLAPLMRFSENEFPLKRSLIDHLKGIGWTHESHKNFTYAINVIGEEIWSV